jgi:hypothetical protein
MENGKGVHTEPQTFWKRVSTRKIVFRTAFNLQNRFSVERDVGGEAM